MPSAHRCFGFIPFVNGAKAMEDTEMQEFLCGSVYHKDYVYIAMNRIALMYNWCSDPRAIECSSEEEFYQEYGNCSGIIYCKPIENTEMVYVLFMKPCELNKG